MRKPGFASLILAAGLSAAGVDPSVLPEGVLESIQLDSATVLCVADSGLFFTLDVPTGETAAWLPSWTPEDDG